MAESDVANPPRRVLSLADLSSEAAPLTLPGLVKKHSVVVAAKEMPCPSDHKLVQSCNKETINKPCETQDCHKKSALEHRAKVIKKSISTTASAKLLKNVKKTVKTPTLRKAVMGAKEKATIKHAVTVRSREKLGRDRFQKVPTDKILYNAVQKIYVNSDPALKTGMINDRFILPNNLKIGCEKFFNLNANAPSTMALNRTLRISSNESINIINDKGRSPPTAKPCFSNTIVMPKPFGEPSQLLVNGSRKCFGNKTKKDSYVMDSVDVFSINGNKTVIVSSNIETSNMKHKRKSFDTESLFFKNKISRKTSTAGTNTSLEMGGTGINESVPMDCTITDGKLNCLVAAVPKKLDQYPAMQSNKSEIEFSNKVSADDYAMDSNDSVISGETKINYDEKIELDGEVTSPMECVNDCADFIEPIPPDKSTSNCTTSHVAAATTACDKPKTHSTSLVENKFISKGKRAAKNNLHPTTRAIMLKINELPSRPIVKRKSIISKKLERAKNFVTEIVCYKCDYCPQMSLKKEMMDLHMQKGGVCTDKLTMVKCPGCSNVFATQMSLRSHLQHDHNMIAKDVKNILRNLHRVKLDQDKVSSSCAYATGPSITGPSEDYSKNLPITLQSESSGELTDLSQERSSCAKRPTMLESYLDEISSKSNARDPPRLSESGPDLLENTFNFTTPVSEQLPSIQAEHPPGAADVDSVLLVESDLTERHLMDSAPQQVEQQYLMEENDTRCLEQAVHGPDLLQVASSHILHDEETELTPDTEFLNIAHAFAQHPDIVSQNRFKDGQGNDYFCVSPGIPVIQLDDKAGEEFDFSSFATETVAKSAPVLVLHTSSNMLSCCPVPDVNEMSEEKKAEIKKLGCGFRCNINGCKFRMQSEENIKYHRRCHEGKLYNCPECCKDCSTWISLSSHLWQAHKIDMELYKCDLCPYRTPSYSRLTGIHRGIHGTSRPFLCDICGKGFKTIKQMRNHKNTHKAKMIRSSNCTCCICGRTVADKRLLQQHIATCHDKSKPFLCSVCGYSTGLKHSLIIHIRKHTGEKPYVCDKCDYRSADHNALRRHKMKHNGSRNYKCSHCTFTCIQASTFKMHIKVKHPLAASEIIFSCSHCNFQSLQRGKYLTHMSDHRRPPKLTEDSFFTNPVEFRSVPPEEVVETIVDDLSRPQPLLPGEYYDVQHLTN